jgi:hypothetical protein
MLFVSTAEDLANSVGKLVSTKQPLGLNYLPLAMNPLRLDRIEPRALGGQQTWHYPDPTAAGFDLAVVGDDPLPHFMAFVPACVVPDEKQCLLALLLEPVATSRPRNPQPTVDGSRRAGSAGLEPLFARVLRIRALDPALGPFPPHP